MFITKKIEEKVQSANHKINHSSFFASSLLGLGFSLLTMLLPTQAQAAEDIAFYYSPYGQFKIQVDDLKILANEDRITERLDFFTRRLTPEQLGQLKDILSRKIEFNPIAIYKFSNSPIGEIVLKNIGTAIKSDSNLNGFLALRGAILSSAFSDEGLTLVNMLSRFAHDTIHLDTAVVLRCLEDSSTLLQKKESIVANIKRQSQESQPQQLSATNSTIDPSASGALSWKKETIKFRNPKRSRNSVFDLYLPQSDRQNGQPFPLIVISHGLASNRTTFAYLGEHLASQGFAVAIPEHIGTNSKQFQAILSSLAKPPKASNLVNRPRDIKYLLDTLEENPALKKDINFQQVGVIGQSFGGYTALAVGGAKYDREQLQRDCAGNQHDNVFFNMSALIQCRVNELPDKAYRLRDQRVKAVLAINPLSSRVFGQKGMENLKIPTMMLAGSNDLITPPVQEQIYPFAWLASSQKYLVLADQGTHFSFLDKGKGVLPIPSEFIGPDPELTFPVIKALSTAFFKTHISDRPEYSAYLDNTYLNSLNSNPFEFSLIRTLSETQLEEEYSRTRR